MKLQQINISKTWIQAAVVLVLLGSALGTANRWLPPLRGWVEATVGTAEADASTDDAGHDDHAAHGDSDSLQLSAQARRNVGLTEGMVRAIQLQTFTRYITVPATVVERPGRTRIQVPAPMTGIVNGIYVTRGQAVSAGDRLFRLRLTHEDLVKAQTEYLQTLGELDVAKKEIGRLRDLTKGLVPAKLRERLYEQEKLEVTLAAKREALALHGLSKGPEGQIARIDSERILITEIDVRVPAMNLDASLRNPANEPLVARTSFVQVAETTSSGQQTAPIATPMDPLIVQDVPVHRGQFVNAGETLATLVNYRGLYIEGQAFEHDSDEIELAAKNEWTLTAIREKSGSQQESIPGLRIVYLDNEIELHSRAMRFYVNLPNKIVHATRTPEGFQVIGWRFKPGQRLQLRVPVEQWSKQIVLPVDAVAQEGAEYFVFQENGNDFDRRPVHIQYRDQFQVVIANDGSLFPGDKIALTGAHQMQIALKNKSGGGVDPHAGHSH